MEEELKKSDITWSEFIARYNRTKTQIQVGFDDIPWPVSFIPSPKTNKIAMRSTAYFEFLAERDATVAKRKIKSLILRWHPDKFIRKFMLKALEKDSIISRLHLLTAGLTQLLGRTNEIESKRQSQR